MGPLTLSHDIGRGDGCGEFRLTAPLNPETQLAVDQLLDEAEALADLEAALPLYERALALDPDRSATHYNIGLVCKYRGAWACMFQTRPAR